MVAIITGKGAGVENGSLSVLGSRGQLGGALLGRSQESVYVNAATGNLVLTDVDEMLVGRGPDAVVSRTYNSQGAWDGDNDDYWRAGVYRRVTGLTGAFETTGSTVRRTDWDGSEITYTWDAGYSDGATTGFYVATDGGGAYDTLKRTGTTWTWTDGDSRVTETYDDSNAGRITERTDTSGNSVTYAYTSGLVTRVTTGNGEYTELTYSGTQLTSLVTYSTVPTAQVTRTFYEYDGSDRLIRVKVNLDPADNSKSVGSNYETTYAYDGASQRVASITQTDGTLVSFLYTQYGADHRISKITQTSATGVARVTDIVYDIARRITTITDAAGQVTRIGYDAANNLTKIVTPPAGAALVPLVVEFAYQADGDVLSVKPGPGDVIVHADGVRVADDYDTHGNRQFERDSAGNTIRRTFSLRNELLTETVYLVADADGSGSGQPSAPITTRYAYDAQSNLRFVVDGTGRVTEYVYDGYGQQIVRMAYGADTYSLSGLAAGTSIALGSLVSWVSGVDKSAGERTETTYDFRGAVTEVISYSKLLGTGAFDTSSERSRTIYIYSPHGELLSRQLEGSSATETYAYDGLARVRTSTDFDSIATTIVYNDSASNTVVTLANGLVRTSTYNRAGELISVQEAGGTTAATTTYGYDSLGRLRRVTDPTGQSSYFLYDAIGRKVADIDADGSLTEYRYDANGNLASTTAYATRLTATQLAALRGEALAPSNLANTTVAQQPDGLYRVTKSGGGSLSWNADANSTEGLAGDFALQVRIGGNNVRYMAGLSTSASGTGTPAMSQGIFFDSNGVAYYFNSPGQSSLSPSANVYYAAGDSLWMVRTGTTLTFYKGATLAAATAAGALRTVTGVGGTLYLHNTIYTSGAYADIGFTPAVPKLDAIRPDAHADDRWEWRVYDRAQRLVQTIDGAGATSVYEYDGASRLVATTQRANLVSGAALTAMKTAATAPNVWEDPDDGTAWTLSNVTLAASEEIDGANAYALTIVANGAGYATHANTIAVAAGDTATFSFAVKGGSVTTIPFGIAGFTTGWDGGADATAAVIEGPGTITQHFIGLWHISGLSTTEVTRITVTRTFAQAENISGRPFAGNATGNWVIVADPVLTVMPTTPVNLPMADPTNDRVARVFYDNGGRLVGTLDAEGYLTETVYDGAGRKVRTIAYAEGIADGTLKASGAFADLLADITPSSANDIRNQWMYDARGLVRAAVDGEGTLTRYTYTAAGELAQQVRGQKLDPATTWTLATLPAAGGAILETVAWTYDLHGQPVTETRTLTGGTTTTTAYGYDAMRRLVSTVTQSGGADPRTYDRRYDVEGRLIGELSGEGSIALAALVDPDAGDIDAVYAAHGWTYAYDAADRLISKAGPGGTRTLYYYTADDALAYEVNAAGEVAEYRYNAFGERSDTIVHARRIASGTLSGMAGGLVAPGVTTIMAALDDAALDSRTTVEFNVDGTVEALTDPLSHVTAYTYNAFGELASSSADLDNDGLAGAARTVVTEFAYDRRGLLRQETVDPGGTNIQTSYGHDAFGRAITLTDATLAETKSTYDRKGRLTEVEDALGNETRYAYDARDNLVAVTDALGNVTRHVYDKANRRIATIDATGGLTRTSYDADGRVVETRAYKNRITVSGSEIAENDATLTTALANYDTADRVTRYAYDKDGQLRFTIDALMHVVEYRYDDAGNAIRAIAYDGTISPGSYSETAIAAAIATAGLAAAAGTRVTRSIHDAATNRLTYSIDAIGQVTWFVYDAKGQVTKQVEFAALYTAGGDPSVGTMTGWTGTNANATHDRTTRAWYDNKGQLAYSIDALGYVTRIEYDKQGNVKKQSRYADLPNPGSITINDNTLLTTLDSYYASPPSTRVTRFGYDSAGRLETTTDPEGFVTRLVLDAMGRITSSTAAFGTSAASITTYAYDDVGRVTLETRAYGAAEVTATAYVYDALGQLTQQTAASGTGDASVSKWEYDALGQVTKATRGHGTTEVTDSLTAYDVFGRVTSSTDPRGSIVSHTYDAIDRLLTQTEQLESGSTDDRVTSWTYDSFGNAVKAVDPRGNDSYAFFDKLGRVTRQVDAERFVTDTAYTRGGAVASVKRWQVGPNLWPDPANAALWSGAGATRTANGTIDGAAAFTLAVQANGVPGYATAATGTAVVSGNTLTFSFWVKAGSVSFASFGLAGSSSNWGSNGDTTASILAGSGTLTQVGGGLWTVSGLTGDGTLVTVTRTFGATETASARIYAGSSTSSAVAANSVVVARPALGDSDAVTSFAYNKRDEVTGVTDAQGFSETYALNAFGERVTVTSKLGHATTYDYDGRGLVTSETLPVDTVAAVGGGTIAVVNRFEYDGRGNLTKRIEAFEAVEQRTTDYTYDKLDRLTLTEHDPVTIVNPDLSETTSVTPTETIRYDRRGNVIETIVEMGTTDARTLAWYDDLDRRIAQVDPMGALTRWAYDDAGNVTSMSRFGDLENMATLTTASAVPAGGSDVRTTTYAYDRSNRLTSTTVTGLLTGQYSSGAYATGTTDIVTELEYDKAGNVIREEDGRDNSVWNWYDKLGRAIARVDAERYLTVWERDAEGNVLRETRYADQIGGGETFTAATAVATLRGYADDDPANDRITEFVYDRNGRRTEERRLKVAYTSVSSTGVASDIAASDGSAVSRISYTYNGLGQVLTRTEANLADIAVSTTAREAVAYTYDAIGRLTLETGQAFLDQNGATVSPRTAYAYDGLNNLKSTRVQKDASGTHADDRVTTYAYGAGGRLATMTDAAGFIRTYGYDLAGRTVRESHSRLKSDGVTSLTEAQVTRYDLAGRAITQTNARLASSTWVFTDGIGGAGNPYDAVRIRYNAYGEITGRGLTAGPAATAVYQETFDYDAGGRLWRSNAGDGVLRFFAYDKAGNQTLTLASTGADLSGLTFSTYIAALAGTGDASTATYTRYDRRGQALETIEPGRRLTASTTATITRSRAYNAFGEVKSETDGRGYVTSFSYNTMGRLVSKVAPQVSVTSVTGAVSNHTPTETYGYDLAGRLVSVTDANGNVTRRHLLAGTGHGAAEALVTREYHPDSGIKQTRYDVFGDARTLISEVGNAEARDYDKMGRLVTQTHPGRAADSIGNPGVAVQLVDHYAYDGLGRRVAHWNSQLTASVRETSDYDTQGRIVSTVNFAGEATTYAYLWEAGTVTTGLGSFGGWKKTTANVVASKDAWERQDYFGRTVDSEDYGGHGYDYGFDKGGRLTARSNGGGESIGYGWHNTGLAAGQTGTQGTAAYGYDANGNRTAESFVKSGVSYRGATAGYDALNRMTAWSDSGYAGAAPASQAWEYDRAGNVRYFSASFSTIDATGAVTAGGGSQAYWYVYDQMNRFVITKGVLDGARGSGVIRRGSEGSEIGYYLDGARKSALYDAQVYNQRWAYLDESGQHVIDDGDGDPEGSWQILTTTGTGQRREDYYYTADGYLAATRRSDSTTAPGEEPEYPWSMPPEPTYVAPPAYAAYSVSESDRDAMGRVTWYKEYGGIDGSFERKDIVYDAAGRVLGETTVLVRRASAGNNVLDTYTTHLANSYSGGLLVQQLQDTFKNGSDSGADNAVPDSRQVYSHDWWDGAIQKRIDNDNDNDGDIDWTTTYNYDASGRVTGAAIVDGRSRTVSYVTDQNGAIVARDEEDGLAGGDPRQLHYHYAGLQIGQVGNNGTDNLQYVAAIRDRLAIPPATAAAFRNGASAATPFADFEQSYDAINGYGSAGTASGYTANGGETLAAIAQAVWGDASLWYLLADANGLSGAETLVAGQVVTIPNKVRNSRNAADTWRPYDPNQALGDASPTDARPGKNNKCGFVGAILVQVVALAVTAALSAIGGPFGTFGGRIVTAMIANAASQGTAIAIGLQDGFSFKGVALAGLQAGVTLGLDRVGAFGALGIAGAGPLSLAARAVVSETVYQGIATATRLQKKFDYVGVAAAGVGALIGAAPGAGNKPMAMGQFASMLTSSMANTFANAAARTIIEGSSFGDNIVAALPSVIAQTLGGAVAQALAGNGRTGPGQHERPNATVPSWLSNASFIPQGEITITPEAQRLLGQYRRAAVSGSPAGSANSSTGGAASSRSTPSSPQSPAPQTSADHPPPPKGYNLSADTDRTQWRALMETEDASLGVYGKALARDLNYFYSVEAGMGPLSANIDVQANYLYAGIDEVGPDRWVSVRRYQDMAVASGSPELQAVAEGLIDRQLAWDYTHPWQAGAWTVGRFSHGALGSVVNPALNLTGDLTLGTWNYFAPDASIGSYNVTNVTQPIVTVAGALGGDTDSTIRLVMGLDAAWTQGTQYVDRISRTNDKYGAWTTFQLYTGDAGNSAGTVVTLGYGGARLAISARGGTVLAAETKLAGGTFDLGVSGSQYTLRAPTIAGFEGVSGTVSTRAFVVHGNSAASPRTAYLYELYQIKPDGANLFLKNGVTQNMDTRYTQGYMKDKFMIEIDRGARSDMLVLERQRTLANPGPLNLESWAKKARSGQ